MLFLNITSDDPERLFHFYRDTIGLPVKADAGPHTVDAGGAAIGFDGHSQTRGRAKEPSRFLVDLWVDDIAAEDERLATAGLTPIRKQGVELWGGVISTYEDPDGNFVQLIQYRPDLATAQAPA